MIAKQVVGTNPADLEALMASEIDGQTVQALQTAAVAEIGEKITIRRFARMEGAVDTYIHLGGSRGVLVQFAAPSDPEAMHDVALQIAAASPVCVDVASLPQEFIDHERAVQLATAKEENAQSAKPKPDAIVEKMVEGRMQKYYKEVCLMEQQFVKNPDVTIKDMLKAKNASKVLAFVRFEKGEGIEKRQENFADEIAKMTK